MLSVRTKYREAQERNILNGLSAFIKKLELSPDWEELSTPSSEKARKDKLKLSSIKLAQKQVCTAISIQVCDNDVISYLHNLSPHLNF